MALDVLDACPQALGSDEDWSLVAPYITLTTGRRRNAFPRAHVPPADSGDREAVARLAADISGATGDTVDLATVDQDYTGETAASTDAAERIKLKVVAQLSEANRRFILLPRR